MTDNEKKVMAETINERKLAKAEILAELDKLEKAKFGVDVKTVLVTVPDVNDAGMRNNDLDGYDHTDKRLMRHFLPVNNSLGGFRAVQYELHIDPTNYKPLRNVTKAQMELEQTWSPAIFDTTQTPPKDDRMPLLMGDFNPLDPRELPNLERYRLPEHLNIPNTPLKPGELMADLPFDEKYLPLMDKISDSRKAALAMVTEKTKLSNDGWMNKLAKHGSVGAHVTREMGPLFNKEIHVNLLWHKHHEDGNRADLIMGVPFVGFKLTDHHGSSGVICRIEEELNKVALASTAILIKEGRGRGFNKLVIPGTKRKIVIYFSGAVKNALTDENLKYVVQLASKKGWKKVYLQRDDTWGETIELLNLSQMLSNYHLGKSGIFISTPPSWESNYE
jgi:hypothetical protein